MAKASNFPGFGKLHFPPGWQKPCQAGQWLDGVLAVSSPSTLPSAAVYDDVPVAIAPDGNGGAFVLTTGTQNWFAGTQGPFMLRPISATGKPGPLVPFGDPRGWIGVIGVWSEAVVVASGVGRCILAGGKTQALFGGGNRLEAQRFDQTSTPLWNGGSPVVASGAFPPGSSQANPNNLVGEPDGADGALLAWLMPDAVRSDYVIQIQRLGPGGQAQWGPDGLSFGSASGPVAYFQTPWIQLVPDSQGGAIVLSLQRAGVATDYVAYQIDPNGVSIGAPATVVTGAPNGWIGNLRLRRAVTDGQGGLFLAYVDGTPRLHLLRYHPTQGVVWDVIVGNPLNSNAFDLREDDRGGALITFISATRDLNLRRIDAAGTTTWDVATAPGNLPLQLILPSASSTWPAHQWARVAQAVPKGDGGAVLIFQFWANRLFEPRLHSICFDSNGSRVNPEQEITARPTAQASPVAIPVGGAAVVAWADDGNAVNAGLDVWAQRVGCCPPSAGGLEPWPPFPCEIIDFSGAGFGDMILQFPCGNGGVNVGIIPLSRLAANVPGADFPPSIVSRQAPSPDWMRLSFHQLPRGTTVQLLSMKRTPIAKGRLLPQTGVEGPQATSIALTFAPSKKDDLILAFTNPRELSRDARFPVRVRCEWGDGKPAPLTSPRRL